jgi:hypothetical protein
MYIKDNNIYYNYIGFSVYVLTIISIALFIGLNIFMVMDIINKYYNNIMYGLPISILIISIIIINNNFNYKKVQLDSDKIKLGNF